MEIKRFKKRTVLKHETIQKDGSGVVPAINNLPKWYKDIPKVKEGVDPNFLPHQRTVKGCTPFLDSFTTGYQIVTLCDIGVTYKENDGKDCIAVTWEGNNPPLASRNAEDSGKIPIPTGYVEDPFAWLFNTSLNFPKEYSILVTHPLNRFDLPFLTLSAVIDGGWSIYSGNVPFFLKKDFVGIIPVGTPIAQLIPFKREEWEAKHSLNLFEESLKNKVLSLNRHSWYKNTYWQRKTYK
jgi:hypothetical protein